MNTVRQTVKQVYQRMQEDALFAHFVRNRLIRIRLPHRTYNVKDIEQSKFNKAFYEVKNHSDNTWYTLHANMHMEVDAPTTEDFRPHFHALLNTVSLWAALPMAEKVTIARDFVRLDLRDDIIFARSDDARLVVLQWLVENQWDKKQRGFGISEWQKPIIVPRDPLSNEYITLDRVERSLTRHGTDRWYATSGVGLEKVIVELYREHVRMIANAGHDVALFEQGQSFSCKIVVLLSPTGSRRIVEVQPPTPGDASMEILEELPAPSRAKKAKTYVAARKVDSSTAIAAMERAKLLTRLNLPLDASDADVAAAQENRPS